MADWTFRVRALFSPQEVDESGSIDSLLAAANSAKSPVLSATVWLTDMSTFAEMNQVWDAWVVPGAPPARVTVGVAALGSTDFNVEISIIAAQFDPERSLN